jgi:hypothetical protein
MTLPFLPSEVWLIIFEHTIRYKLDAKSINDLYYFKVLPEAISDTDVYTVGGIRRIARLNHGAFHQENKKRRTKIDHIKKLRLVCKRFSRVLPRSPPDYISVAHLIYKDCPQISSWCRNDTLWTPQCKYTAIVLGILWCFLRVRFRTSTKNSKQKTFASISNIKNKYGLFSIVTTHCCYQVVTPIGRYECHSDGLSLLNTKYANQSWHDRPISFDDFIDKCRTLYNSDI